MANLLIDMNNKDGASEYEVGYRIYGSGAAFTVLVPNPVSLPAPVSNVPNNRYESYIKKKCATSGLWSDPVYGVSEPCSPPASFSVIVTGLNFSITYALAAGQSKFYLEITDPNGGVSKNLRTDGNSGTFTIPITPKISGGWRFRMAGVCDDTSNPVFASDFTGYVNVTVADNTVCPPVTNLQVTNITKTTATISATPPADASNVAGYTLTFANVADQIPQTLTSATPVFNLTTLVMASTYSYYIQTNCGNNVGSTPVFGGTFTTNP